MFLSGYIYQYISLLNNRWLPFLFTNAYILDVYMPSPSGDVAHASFDAARHAAFGRLLDAWGDPALTALRHTVLAGGEPDPALTNSRFARSAIRAARAQVLAMGI